jgi:hypothetical protein
VKFRNGTSTVDLGVVDVTPPNDLGEVLFSTHSGAGKIYKNGAATDVAIPDQMAGFPPMVGEFPADDDL